MKSIVKDDRILMDGQIFRVEAVGSDRLLLVDQHWEEHIVSRERPFLQVGDYVLYKGEKWCISYLNRSYGRVTLRQKGKFGNNRVKPSEILPLTGQNEDFLSLLKTE